MKKFKCVSCNEVIYEDGLRESKGKCIKCGGRRFRKRGFFRSSTEIYDGGFLIGDDIIDMVVAANIVDNLIHNDDQPIIGSSMDMGLVSDGDDSDYKNDYDDSDSSDDSDDGGSDD